MIINVILAASLLWTALGGNPKDNCFTEHSRRYGMDSYECDWCYKSFPDDSDLDKLWRLEKDHVLTEIRVCETEVNMIFGVTLKYGEWSYGRVTNEKTLYTHGTDMNAYGGSCSSLELSDCEYISALRVYYIDEFGVAGLYFRTNKYRTKNFGNTGTSQCANGICRTVKSSYTLSYGFSNRFYGFVGGEHPDYTSGVE